jgi:hypothetical protein
MQVPYLVVEQAKKKRQDCERYEAAMQVVPPHRIKAVGKTVSTPPSGKQEAA